MLGSCIFYNELHYNGLMNGLGLLTMTLFYYSYKSKRLNLTKGFSLLLFFGDSVFSAEVECFPKIFP